MNRRINCLVVDDEELSRMTLEDLLGYYDYMHCCGSCDDALKADAVLKKEPVDVLFMDIEMPMISGIEFIKTLQNPPLVVFTTSHHEYALEGFELNLFDYLVKPITHQRFHKTASRIFGHFSRAGNPQRISDKSSIFIKENDGYQKLMLEDILFLESDKYLLKVHTTRKTFVIYKTLAEMLEEIADPRYLRIHKSYAVNTDAVDGITGNELKIGEQKLPVGQTYREDVFRRLLG